MSRYSYYPPYVSVAERKKRAEKERQKLAKKGIQTDPIVVTKQRGDVTTSWWGNAWSQNLERYADYTNRIDRGKRYVRNGSVIDLKIKGGHVDALVQGNSSRPYEVTVDIDPLDKMQTTEILNRCANKLESLDQLASGSFPKELGDLFTQRGGLFPTPKQIHFDCTCPDWASMCKHVAAVLYGIGVRLDRDPLLIFELRGLDPSKLIDSAIGNRVEQMLQNANNDSPRIIKDQDWHDMFSI